MSRSSEVSWATGEYHRTMRRLGLMSLETPTQKRRRRRLAKWAEELRVWLKSEGVEVK